jgi:hypothetical protein
LLTGWICNDSASNRPDVRPHGFRENPDTYIAPRTETGREDFHISGSAMAAVPHFVATFRSTS